LLKEARPHALIDNFDLNMLLSPKSSARPKLLRRYFPHATSEDEIPMDELATEREIRQRDTDYFPLTQAQIDYREKESPPIFANVATDKVSYDPYWQDIMTGEPMDLGVGVIRKERKSPEAKRHKLEYDKQYEASPERVKYREELNRERRRRGMYGDHSHRDISHTEGGKLTVEDEHDNRARHFKDKGTKRPLTKGIRGDLELLRNLMNGPMDEQDKKIAQALLTSLDDFKQEQGGEDRKELMHPYPF